MEDTYGNVVTTNTSQVTMAIGTNPGRGQLGGTPAVAAAAGVATFNNLSISAAGTGYTLVAGDGSLASATSQPFNITSARAERFGYQSDGRPGGGRHHGDDHRHELHRRQRVKFGRRRPRALRRFGHADHGRRSAGSGTVDVTVTTPGGTSATSAADKFTYVAAPTVTKISPTSGSAKGGTKVTITGTNLANATKVLFGTTAAKISSDSATSIVVTSPAGTGTVYVTVVTAGGTSATSSADKFTYTGVGDRCAAAGRCLQLGAEQHGERCGLAGDPEVWQVETPMSHTQFRCGFRAFLRRYIVCCGC